MDMKPSRFTVAGAGGRGEDGRRLPQARDQQRHVLQVEGQVRRPRCFGCEAAEENAKLKRLLADAMLDNAMLKNIASKNVWSAPALQGLSFCRRKQLA